MTDAEKWIITDTKQWLIEKCSIWDSSVGYFPITKYDLDKFTFENSGISTKYSIKISGEILHKFNKTGTFICFNATSLKNSPNICDTMNCMNTNDLKYLPNIINGPLKVKVPDTGVYDLRYLFFSKFERVEIVYDMGYDSKLENFFNSHIKPDSYELIGLMRKLKEWKL